MRTLIIALFFFIHAHAIMHASEKTEEFKCAETKKAISSSLTDQEKAENIKIYQEGFDFYNLGNVRHPAKQEAPEQRIVDKFIDDDLFFNFYCRRLRGIISEKIDLNQIPKIEDEIQTQCKNEIVTLSPLWAWQNSQLDRKFRYCTNHEFMMPVVQKYIEKEKNNAQVKDNTKLSIQEFIIMQNYPRALEWLHNAECIGDKRHDLVDKKNIMFKAIECDADQIATWLFAKGLPNNYNSSKNQTYLHWAARYGAIKTIPVLIAAKIDVNAQDNQGRTALHVATEECSYFEATKKIAGCLLQHGADVSLVTTRGKTALDLPTKYQERITPQEFRVIILESNNSNSPK